MVNNVGETSRTSNPHAPLIHMEMKVKEQRVMAMVDSKAQVIVGIACGVSISTGSLVRKHNLMVMLLGEFDIILGIDFLRKF